MRKILFRGKKITNGAWAYGYLNFVYVDNSNHANIYDQKAAFTHDVFTETVGQFTGLLDKNGTKIFEGDIVKVGSKNYAVEWVEGCLCGWMLCNNFNLWDTSFEAIAQKNYEVIGNIYDNLDLLREDKKDG